MARIRSIHPGWFTDDAVMGTSIPARLFVIGLWGECDDQGIFQWKPLTLKARIVPADSVDVATLLDELVTQNFIKKFSHKGSEFGVVRNFCRFQRPKKPNRTHFMPPEFRTYAGITTGTSPPNDDQGGGSTEPVPHQSRTFPAEGGEGRGVGGKGRGPQAFIESSPIPESDNLQLSNQASAREKSLRATPPESVFLLDGKNASGSPEEPEVRHHLLESLDRLKARGAKSGHESGPVRSKPNGAAEHSDSPDGATLSASPLPAT